MAALDVGGGKVLAAVALLEPEGLRVLGVGRAVAAGVRCGAVVDLEAATAAIAAAGARARRVAGRTLPPLMVGSAGGRVLSDNRTAQVRFEQPTEIGRAEVDAVQAEVRRVALPGGYQLVHALTQGYLIDGYPGSANPVGVAAESLGVESHLVACEATVLHNLWNAVHRAGLQLDDFSVCALASAEAVLTDQEREKGVVLADVGATATQIAVLAEGAPLVTATLPVGSQHVTADIVSVLGLDPQSAEEAKRRGRLPEGTQADAGLTEVIDARSEELLEGVRQRVRAAGLEAHIGAGLVLTGGGSRVAGLSAAAMRVLEWPVRCGGAAGIDGPLGAPEYAACIGLLQLAARRRHAARRMTPLAPIARWRLGRWLAGGAPA